MISSLISILLAILGLGLLIFIHELGHYWMARRAGMRVEIFSIGFGRPVASWKHDGVKWQLGWLPFGGYVKIAGMDFSEADEKKGPDTFFAQPPWKRILVAFMGPFVNLVFALLIFAAIWMLGGREKNFSEFTDKIGWVDPKSELYVQGIRPGDEIKTYNGHDYTGSKDHYYAPMTADEKMKIVGDKIDYQTGEKKPFTVEVSTYSHPLVLDEDIKTAGILNPANYIIYNPTSKKKGLHDPFADGSSVQESGIKAGDRIIWVDGHRIFSSAQMNYLLNDQRLLMTIKRGNQVLFRRVARVQIEELKLLPVQMEEYTDWQHEAGLGEKAIQKLYGIPYDITPYGIVESRLAFIDRETDEEVFPKEAYSELEEPLQEGDRILAVNGVMVRYAHEIFRHTQEKKVQVIVQRDPALINAVGWHEANQEFEGDINTEDLNRLANQIGKEVGAQGNLHLLLPLTPLVRREIPLPPEKQALLEAELKEKREEIDKIEDPDRRAYALQMFDRYEKELVLGIRIRDRQVVYNPGPFEAFSKVTTEMWRTLSSLVMGYLNPKFISGPIGIVHVVQSSWGVSIKEALFWLGVISLNLGVLNLLPIPVLDGGYICIFFVEMITGRRLHRKTMEKLIIPFVVMVVGMIFYVTYNDLSRLLSQFFNF